MTKGGNTANYFGLADEGINKWPTLSAGWQTRLDVFPNTREKILVSCLSIHSQSCPSAGVESSKLEILGEVRVLRSSQKSTFFIAF